MPSGKSGEALEAILERLPYGDGAIRRRFIAGGVVLLGAIIWYWNDLRDFRLPATLEALPGTMVAAFVVLFTYAIGTAVETLQSIFALRAAAAIVPAMFRRVAFSQLFPAQEPSTDPKSSALSADAARLFVTFPEMVQDGLRHPLGDNADLAAHWLTTRLTAEEDRRWARKLLARSADLAVTTTAVIVILVPAMPMVMRQIAAPGQMATEYWRAVNVAHIAWLADNEWYAANLSQRPPDWADPRLTEYFSAKDRGEASALTPAEATQVWAGAVRHAERRKEWHLFSHNGVSSAQPLYQEQRRLDERVRAGQASLNDRTRLVDVNREIRQIETAIMLPASHPAIRLRYALENLKEAAFRNDQEVQRKGALVVIALCAVPFLLLLLYVGYFWSFRNSLKAIVETIALKEPNQLGRQPVEVSAHIQAVPALQSRRAGAEDVAPMPLAPSNPDRLFPIGQHFGPTFEGPDAHPHRPQSSLPSAGAADDQESEAARWAGWQAKRERGPVPVLVALLLATAIAVIALLFFAE